MVASQLADALDDARAVDLELLARQMLLGQAFFTWVRPDDGPLTTIAEACAVAASHILGHSPPFNAGFQNRAPTILVTSLSSRAALYETTVSLSEILGLLSTIVEEAMQMLASVASPVKASFREGSLSWIAQPRHRLRISRTGLQRAFFAMAGC